MTTIQFTKVESKDAVPPDVVSAPTPRRTLWLPPVGKSDVEQALFHFLNSLADRSPQVTKPLLFENNTSQALYADPHPDLHRAMQNCLHRMLLELTPNPEEWGEFELPPVIYGIALAAYIALTPNLTHDDEIIDPLDEFGEALLDTLPPARTLPELLAWHALIGPIAEGLDELQAPRAALMRGLLELSPLSALCHLHHHTPVALSPLAEELLPGWRARDSRPWRDSDEWLSVLSPALELLAIARRLRLRWLQMPETRPACRNLGLFLELLRRQGGYRDFILNFYEAYEHATIGRYNSDSRLPLLAEIERLLRAPGDSEAAIRLNRWGNEYFLKFHALLETVIAEDGLPTDFRHLTPELVLSVRKLLPWVTEVADSAAELESIEFVGNGQ
uniref:Uncharacterized protein n=1 Tax=Candidatus Kentrum sp. FM TaxID=2126340 RepID=A0A450SDR5_9GAMM|nr:MAG: hypothetical protein BECKFM1743C_GA0114222_100883 [Candidatus Kentron sp. FM]VFJ50727.1 MAG: hypothetical protein BECKFM1743A_GA0114220_100873 [Candidatus Kentron sp. FM]VFK08739.1 MAG: hypothetical protein BECKFM1743B_GA0114221_100803 [Candidatus Kentron sp. FM]